ncbi:MAG: hypothetical protein KDC18_12080 [Alphaproteobacteria bacterium]|nr:hypothetical protein [Alphaproteobacteria bacterium]MCB9929576.1 hypothetical protein [Alphaproteobacteria bacterium]
MPEWVEIDEPKDIYHSLNETLFQLKRIKAENIYWKWSIIALTCSVNSALVFHLTGTYGIGALEENCAEKTLSALNDFECDSEYPKSFLAKPIDLLKRVSGKLEPLEYGGGIILINEIEFLEFKKIFQIRNEFIHYKPTSWAIEVSGLPNSFFNVMSIIQKIIDNGYALRHLSAREREEIIDICAKIYKEIDSIKRQYES